MCSAKEGWLQGNELACEPSPNLAGRPLRLVLLGQPGVGKGTQATQLCKRLRCCHLSTGELFRTAKACSSISAAMREALDAMNRGELVSDETVVSMIRERSTCLRCEGGFLLDGFPRTISQAVALEQLLAELNAELDAVVCYDLPLKKVVARLSGRRICGDCQSVFHVEAHPPTVADICDVCGGRLIVRDDDKPEAVRVRMETYEADTRPLIDFYRTSQKLKMIPADGTPDEVLNRTLKAVVRVGAMA